MRRLLGRRNYLETRKRMKMNTKTSTNLQTTAAVNQQPKRLRRSMLKPIRHPKHPKHLMQPKNPMRLKNNTHQKHQRTTMHPMPPKNPMPPTFPKRIMPPKQKRKITKTNTKMKNQGLLKLETKRNMKMIQSHRLTRKLNKKRKRKKPSTSLRLQ